MVRAGFKPQEAERKANLATVGVPADDDVRVSMGKYVVRFRTVGKQEMGDVRRLAFGQPLSDIARRIQYLRSWAANLLYWSSSTVIPACFSSLLQLFQPKVKSWFPWIAKTPQGAVRPFSSRAAVAGSMLALSLLPRA